MQRPPHAKDLRKGRYSEPNARYFVTFNTVAPTPSISEVSYFQSLSTAVFEMESAKQLSEASFTVMPDHVHLLFRLGSTLTLSQAIAKLKQRSRGSARVNPLHWQNGFHDHKLRNDSELHPILHYMYLNPYRARLLDQGSIWHYVHVEPSAWNWIQPLLLKDCPYPEWLTD
ncbi:transposase [Pelagicoccus enzymogenes]|uniref:REP-associated tyrosine transposase n=1 Tax=Pelagicoccus enzymogenes TaxID=2773457 RepID=UPI00280C9EC6|nr:transposase [Pelagicoccus enzymogenes]MDQ8200924.1 transposase [Pelagicoccus enzymogenes]